MVLKVRVRGMASSRVAEPPVVAIGDRLGLHLAERPIHPAVHGRLQDVFQHLVRHRRYSPSQVSQDYNA